MVDTVERAINKLKHARAVGTRYDKRGYIYLGTDRSSTRHLAPHMIDRTEPRGPARGDAPWQWWRAGVVNTAMCVA
ncbi:hypothetical protein ACFYMX_34040 [Streptomyces griseofuscus]|uniref:hypothetical protein n=1 Tax=Streptomyces griseofuscus TaxID=146922 RepID=UPI0036739372